MRRRSQRGNAMLEMAMYVPILVLLLMGSVEVARLTYIYYTLHKMLETVATYVSTRQGVNFCDDTDATIVAAKAFAISGSSDTTGQPIVANLTADMIQISIQRYNSDSQTLAQCDCSATGCDLSQGGLAPDYIEVSIPDGYPITPTIPYVAQQQILFKPIVVVRYGGT
jgi:Flp pilus assembly protein TadG